MAAQGPQSEICVGVSAQFGPAAPGLGVAKVMVAHVYGVPLDSLTAATRTGRHEAEARQLAMYLAHVVFRLSMSEVARGFGRDRTTVRHACRHIERKREDPDLDRLVAWLEAMLRNTAGMEIDDRLAGEGQ